MATAPTIQLTRLLVIVVLGCVPTNVAAEPEGGLRPLPGFHLIEEASVRKRQFLDYLRPLVRAENARILAQRAHLLRLAARHRVGLAPDPGDGPLLQRLAAYYRVDTRALEPAPLYRKLLRRVDVLPASLVLAQAAKESGWGASRFAQRGNSLFGEYCFEPGCGVVPRHRAAGRTYEVERFTSARASVASYLRNLNSHASYRELRLRRERLRDAGMPLSGIELAEGLTRYSERGVAYVREVQTLIRQNDLEGFVMNAAGAGASVSGQ